MDKPSQMKTVVLGLGNLIQSDDGVGLFALRRLEQDPRVPPDVSLVEGGTKGLELVPYVCEASHLLVLDSLEAGAPAGTVLRVEGEDLRSLPGRGSAHQLALADLLVALRMLGKEPQQTVLLGVQPANTDLGVQLTPSVEAAVPMLVEAAVAELSRWARLAPGEPHVLRRAAVQ
jgi:hydrogenase maturation protease